jgi:hypothetical protein
VSAAAWAALGALLAAISSAGAQGDSAKAPKAPKAPRPPARIFEAGEPLAVTLTANIGRLRRDVGDKVPWRGANLAYTAADGRPATMPIAVRTRGFWRLKECAFPPLRLNFADKVARGTPFEGLDKPKLVNYCRDTDDYEQYVLQELQLYRVYALLAPAAHRTRLLRVAYADSASGRVKATRYAILLEEPKALAARVGGQVIDVKGAQADDFEPYNAAVVGLFQYMIGNSDWSSSQLHNAEVVRDSSYDFVLVPYDFDFAGAVNARYATVDPRLGVGSVRERLYRGHCVPAEALERAVARFKERKGAIYALYADPIGRLLRPLVVRETLAYFDEFYRIIDSPNDVRDQIASACRSRQ